MIVVFDASSLVGAVLREGSTPDLAVLEVVDRGTLVVSRDVLAEYHAVLRRPKFAGAVSSERREGMLELIEAGRSLLTMTHAAKLWGRAKPSTVRFNRTAILPVMAGLDPAIYAGTCRA